MFSGDHAPFSQNKSNFGSPLDKAYPSAQDTTHQRAPTDEQLHATSNLNRTVFNYQYLVNTTDYEPNCVSRYINVFLIYFKPN